MSAVVARSPSIAALNASSLAGMAALVVRVHAHRPEPDIVAAGAVCIEAALGAAINDQLVPDVAPPLNAVTDQDSRCVPTQS